MSITELLSNPPEANLSRREWLAAFGIGFLGVSCGGNEEGKETSSTDAASPEPTPKTNPQPQRQQSAQSLVDQILNAQSSPLLKSDGTLDTELARRQTAYVVSQYRSERGLELFVANGTYIAPGILITCYHGLEMVDMYGGQNTVISPYKEGNQIVKVLDRAGDSQTDVAVVSTDYKDPGTKVIPIWGKQEYHGQQVTLMIPSDREMILRREIPTDASPIKTSAHEVSMPEFAQGHTHLMLPNPVYETTQDPRVPQMLIGQIRFKNPVNLGDSGSAYIDNNTGRIVSVSASTGQSDAYGPNHTALRNAITQGIPMMLNKTQ